MFSVWSSPRQELTLFQRKKKKKNSDLSKFKAFADVTWIGKFSFERVENIMGKGKNAGYQHFCLFLQCFQVADFSRSLKVGIMW